MNRVDLPPGWRPLVLALLLLVAPQRSFADSQLPQALRDVGIDQHLNQTIPLDTAFRDENGNNVKLQDFFGKRPVILSLVYYECPMLCTLVLNGLTSSLKAMSLTPGTDFDIVTVSFNPHDTSELAAAKKQHYLEVYRRQGAEQSWHFLTGDQESIDRLAKSVGFRYRYQPETGQYAHASGIVILTPDGRIARYLFGVEYAPRDLRLSLVEASRGQIGSVADQLLLYCFQYDAAMGRYTPMVFLAVRIGGIVTVLGLVASILIMRRRDRATNAARLAGPQVRV